MVGPARRRDAVKYLTKRHPVSERRACNLVGQHRSTQRYERVAPDFEVRLVRRMNQLAEQNPRYGYRRIHALSNAEGWGVNRKRIERLWRLEGHRIPARKRPHGQKARGSDASAMWNLPATKPDHVWSYDFVATRSDSGAAIRILNVVDEFTRRSVALKVERHIGTPGVIECLDEAFEKHGKPEVIRSDNGREFIAATLSDWLSERGVAQAFIEKGSPQQNAFVERFNGSMRDEVLNGEIFRNVLEARAVVGEWVDHYNTRRPHRGLGMMTPAAFFESCKVGSK